MNKLTVLQLHRKKNNLNSTDALGQGGVFVLYGGCACAGIAFFYFRVPETKGLSLEAVSLVFADIARRGYYQPLSLNDPVDVCNGPNVASITKI